MRTLAVGLMLVAACQTSRFEEEAVRLRAENARLRQQLEATHAQPRPLLFRTDAGLVQGEVTSVENDLVLCLVGQNDPAAAGQAFSVRRGGVEVGRIRVESVRENLVFGRIERTAAGLRPQRGDTVFLDMTDLTWVRRVAGDVRLREENDLLREEIESLRAGRGASGTVLRVTKRAVRISVGADEGVRVGDVYHIRRGATYVGMIKISRVARTMAIGIFDEEFPGTGAPPGTGDIVYPG